MHLACPFVSVLCLYHGAEAKARMLMHCDVAYDWSACKIEEKVGKTPGARTILRTHTDTIDGLRGYHRTLCYFLLHSFLYILLFVYVHSSWSPPQPFCHSSGR